MKRRGQSGGRREVQRPGISSVSGKRRSARSSTPTRRISASVSR
jgi:hypothetical protein